jgi:hypothetical protein
MKETLINLIKDRVLDDNDKVEGSMIPFEIDGLTYDVDYKASVTTKQGRESGDYDVPNDKGEMFVELHEIEVRNVWDEEGEMLEADKLKEINKNFDNCHSIRCLMIKEVKTEWDIRKCFEELRSDKDHHLGMGDIRLTIGMQEEICDLVERFYHLRKFII